MKKSELALNLDLMQKYNEAINEYEQAINSEPVEVDIYINLAFLYWISAAQFAWADKYDIPIIERTKAAYRYTELIHKAKLIFSDFSELYFWEKYFNHRLLFEPLSEQDVLKIVDKYKHVNLVPFFFLYLFDKKKYKEQRDNLLNECILCPTAKNLYIKSIIEN